MTRIGPAGVLSLCLLGALGGGALAWQHVDAYFNFDDPVTGWEQHEAISGVVSPSGQHLDPDQFGNAMQSIGDNLPTPPIANGKRIWNLPDDVCFTWSDDSMSWVRVDHQIATHEATEHEKGIQAKPSTPKLRYQRR